MTHADTIQAEKPATLQADLGNLPSVLQPLLEQPRFVLWRWVYNPEAKKPWTKVPFQARAPQRKASSTRAATWASYEEALAAYRASDTDGIGFVLTDSDIAAFDLDDCRDAATGEIAPWAMDLVDRSLSYAEITVSGTGLRIIGRATGPKIHRKQRVPGGGSIESYRRAERYIVLTGNVLLDSWPALSDIDKLIDETVARLDKEPGTPEAEQTAEDFFSTGPSDLPAGLERLIQEGVPEGQRSDQFMHVVGWLRDLGWTLEAIVAKLEEHPDGIAAKYKGRLRTEAERCFKKAKPKHTVDLLTEDSAALAFAALHGERLRFCHDHKAWFRFTGTQWEQNKAGIAFAWARELARELSRKAPDKVRFVSGKTSFASGVERFAQTDQALAVTSEIWDRDPFLLGTPGGVVDLRTGMLRPAMPTDFVTKLTAVAPSTRADCPLWMAFLEEATGGDAELVRFLQQWAGYGITGDTREHALVFVYGPGGNGKTVFLNTVSRLVGAYATTAAMDTFTASKNDKHPTDLAMLRGARMVTASETEEGRAWAESRIKQMTGGDPITARFMRQDFFTFRPAFKLTIVGNHKPVLRNVDDAARRRFNIVPFVRKPAAPDPHLEAKLMAEGPGILRWMIEGCLDWQANGLARPSSVRDATDAYFSDQDVFGEWLRERCICEPGSPRRKATTQALFESWGSFARTNNEHVGTVRSFAQTLEARGFRPMKHVPTDQGVRVRGFSGLELRPFSEFAAAF